MNNGVTTTKLGGWITNCRGGSSTTTTTLFGSSTTKNVEENQPPPPPPQEEAAATKENQPPPPPPQEEEAVSSSLLKSSRGIVGSNLFRAKFGDSTYYYNTSNMGSEFRVVFILGGPGAGKGTQSEFLERDYPCVHLSVGALLRAEQEKEDSPHRISIEECLVAGKIVPVEISLALLQRAMEEIATSRGRNLLYLVDGFPRNDDNLHGWNRCMKSIASVWSVLMYSCPLQVLEERILQRAEQGSGRSDDNIVSAQKRFRTFEELTVPIVDTLRQVVSQQQEQQEQQSLLKVQDIDGNRNIKEVWEDTQRIVNDLFANDVWTANDNLMKAIQTNNEQNYRALCGYMEEDDKTTMKDHEGTITGSTIEISNASIDFQTGTKVTTSYDRIMEETTVRETRIWSYEGGIHGWRCIHYYRTPL